MEFIIVGIGIFVMVVLIIELSIYAYKNVRYPNQARVKKRLRKFSHTKAGGDATNIIRKRILSDIPFFNVILNFIPGVGKLDRLLQQANTPYPIGVFILFSVLLVIVAYSVSFIFKNNQYLSILIAVLLGTFPYFLILYLKQKRVRKFKEKFPEALDLIARSLKAGHAFSSGMKLVADEFDDPIGPEFEETIDAINFGVSVQDALKDLSQRIDCAELRYFVVSVILQRETGGNLAEIIESLAHLIREKYKLQGKIDTLAAEGKLSAIILIILPFFVFAYVYMVNPEYINLLFSDPMGRTMVMVALVLMFIGILLIKKMINIKY
jgi:tight adherence protein B